MDDTPDKDQTISPDSSIEGSESSPSESVNVRTSSPSGAEQSAPTVSPDAPAETQPPSQPVVSHHARGRTPWLKILLILIVIAAIAAGGWYFYNKNKDDSKTTATTQSKTIPLLKIGFDSPDYGDLYPNMPPSAYSTQVNSQMFEGLVRYEAKNKIVPSLASTWSNPDNKTWVFTIMPNVKFHDGHTLTPKDVKYSLDTVIASDSDLAQLFGETIASTTVVGNNQVKIVTKDPDPILLNRLAFLYIIDSNLPKGDEPSMAGTGPYEIKAGTKPTDTHMQMTAFNDYHGGKPTVQALDFGGKDSTDAVVKAFKAHEYNIAGPVSASDAKNVAGAYQFTSSEPNVDYLGFNTVKPGPLQNKQVREAIRYAVNAQAIGDASGNQTTPISQMIPPSIAGYNPSITPYKQNIAKAKQLLTQAGYPNGVTIRLSTADDSPGTAEMVKNLKEAGITVTVDQHTDFDEFIDYFSAGKADMFKVNYSSDTLDGLDVITTSLTDVNYKNAKLTDLFAQIDSTTDPAKRLKLLQEAETLIDQDVAVIPLYSEDEVWLMDKNYTIQQDMPSSLLSVYFYKVQLK